MTNNASCNYDDLESQLCAVETDVEELKELKTKVREHEKLIKLLIKRLNEHFNEDSYQTIYPEELEGEEDD